MQPLVKAFGIAVRNARDRIGISQREASRRLEWPVGKLSKIESGDRAKLPPKSEVAELDALYKTDGQLLRVAGYMPGGLPDNLDETLTAIVEHHIQQMMEDVRNVFDR